MVAALADLALRRPRALLAGHLAVLGLAVIVATGAPDHLGIGALGESTGGPRVGGGTQPDLVIATTGRTAVRSAAYRVALRVISSQLRSDAQVASVRRGPISGHGRSTSLIVSLSSDDDADRQRQVGRIETRIDPGPLRVAYGGEVATLLEARDDLAGDLWKLELLALPVALLVLAVALGPRLAVPAVLGAATAIAGSLAGLRIVGALADPSLLGIAPAAPLGLVLGIEAPCLLVARFREEAASASGPEAVRRAFEGGVELALPLALAATAATVGLVATTLDQAPSMVLACALSAGFALASALVSVPALIGLSAPGALEAAGEPRLTRAPRALAGFLGRSRLRTLLAAMLAVAVLVAAATPLLDAESRPFSAADLPSGSPTRHASALAIGGAGQEPGRGATGYAVVASGQDSFATDLPLAAAVSAVALALVLGLGFRSARLVPAALLALLPAAAACGLCVLLFQEGHLAEAIGQHRQGALETGAMTSLLAALGAVSGARAVAAIRATRAERSLGLTAERVAEAGAELTVPAAIVATLIAAAAAGVLVGSDLYPAREFGLAVAAGLLIDLVVLRVPLIAALARWGGEES